MILWNRVEYIWWSECGSLIMNRRTKIYIRKFEPKSSALLWMYMKIRSHWLGKTACYTLLEDNRLWLWDRVKFWRKVCDSWMDDLQGSRTVSLDDTNWWTRTRQRNSEKNNWIIWRSRDKWRLFVLRVST